MSYYSENRDAFLNGLIQFLRIPSISTLPEHRPDVRKAAEFVVTDGGSIQLGSFPLLKSLGFEKAQYS